MISIMLAILNANTASYLVDKNVPIDVDGFGLKVKSVLADFQDP